LAAAASAALAFPVLSHPFVWDQWVFADIADAMRRGGTVYRDAWEHKPPGVYYAYYLAFALFGRDYWGIHLLEILGVAVASAGLAKISVDRFGTLPGGLLAALVLPTLYVLLGGNGAQPESFQIPFLVWGLAVWPRADDRARLPRRCFLAGFLLSLAVLFKTPIVTVLFAVLLDRILIDRGGMGWRARWGPTLWTLAGIALPLLWFTAYYAARGALAELLDAILWFPAKYAAFGLDRSPKRQLWGAVQWLFWLVPLFPALLLSLGIVRGVQARLGETLRWLGAFAAACAGVVIQGKYFEYHYYPILPFLALGFAIPFSTLDVASPEDSPTFRRREIPAVSAAAALAACGIIQYAINLAPHWHGFPAIARIKLSEGLPPEDLQAGGEREVAQWIRASTAPEDRIFVWGNKPRLYFLADRPIAGPYNHLLGIVPPWGEPERLRDFVHRLQRTSPEVFVIVWGDRHWWQGRDSREIFESSGELQLMVRDTFRFVRRIGAYEIWVRMRA
jgi:hypothetical protein